MGIAELFILSVGLSMDAFAVSVCKGLATVKLKPRHMIITGLWFGSFQAMMPLIGYFLGTAFAKYVTAFDHFIAFFLLALIGANMIKESLSKDDDEDSASDNYGFKTMFLMAVATSIDALAAGISLAMDLKGNNTYAYIAVLFIGTVTFTLSAIGVKIGNIYGAKFKSKAEFAGGHILIFLGLRILLEHLGAI